MASFQIREDRENVFPDPRNFALKNSKAPLGQSKRPVLGVLDHNKPERIYKAKQPTGIQNENEMCKNENNCVKNATSKLPPPIVPVAQFEAFKVYEDSHEEVIKRGIEKLQNKYVDEIFKNAYKGTENEPLMTKKEALEKAATLEILKPPVIEIHDECPMSIEKSTSDREIALPICTRNKKLFFELEEYRENIYEYLCQQEKLHRPKPNYMHKQPQITDNMRTILVDWLVEVAEEYKLQTETLYLAVNFIDRFLSYMSVVRAKLQLVGTAAMFIAAKYEEIYPPDAKEFVYITDDTYSKRQVIRMEVLILKVLDFDLSIPTAYTFITALSIACKLTDKVTYLAQYLSELALLEAKPTLEIYPSMMAASAIAVARHTLDEEPWDRSLQETTGYKLKDLRKAIEFLKDLHKKADSLDQKAIQEKYKSGKYLQVSTIPPKETIIPFDE